MGLKTIAGILRAARFKFALGPEKWAECDLVCPDKQYCGTINNLHLNQSAELLLECIQFRRSKAAAGALANWFF
jgi:hypothetical protein